MMVRVGSLALAAMVLCAVLATTTGTIDTTYFFSLITSSFTFVNSSFASAAGLTFGFWRRVLTSVISLVNSSFTSAIGLSLGFCRQILTSVNIDHALKVRARDFAVKQLQTFYHAAKGILVPYISVCRHIVTDAIGEYPLLRLAEEYLLPQPSGLPADFSPHTDTLFLLLATNVCTAIFCLFIGAAILAPLRIIWRITKALASLTDKPEATWETFLERLTPALAHTAAFGVNALVFCGTGLFFCCYTIAMYAADLVTEYLIKRRASKVEPPKVFYRNLPDPLVPELEDQVRKLKSEFDDKSENWNSKFREDSLTISGLMEENEKLENANKAQKLVIAKQWNMQASIDMTRPMHEQLMETRKQRDDAQGNYERIVEEKKAMETNLWTQLGQKAEEIRDLKFSHRARVEEYAALKRSLEYHQDRARKDDELSKLSIEFQKGRVQDLEKLMASEKETLDARVKELLTTIESLEARLKQRDELISTQKEAIQTLEAQKKELEARHLSEQKAQKAHLMKAFERERSKLTNLSRLSSEARKAAEEKYKAADEAREAAEQARKSEEEARKTAEKDSAANLEARKLAEEACKAAEEKRKTAQGALEAAEKARRAAEEESAANLKALNDAHEALKVAEEARKAAEDESASLRERLANRPPSHDKGTQASSPPPSPRMKTPGSPSTTPPGSPSSSPRRTPPPSPQKTPGSPSTTLPGSPGQTPPQSPTKEAPPSSSKGLGPCPPIGQRPILPARSVNRKPKSNFSLAKSGGNDGFIFPNVSSFSFNFLGGTTPNIPGTNPGAPSHGPKTPPAVPSNSEPTNSPAAPSNPEPTTPPARPSTPEPKTPPAEPSTPAPSTPEPKTPQAAPSTPEPANLPALPSSPESSNSEPASPSAGPSTPEPTTPPAASRAESSPGKPSGGSSESKQPEPANTTSAEGSPAKTSEPSAEPSAEPSGEPSEAPEPGSA